MSVFIIAEAGVNHNGKLELALKLVDVAADAGANAIKFQTFKADALACAHATCAPYQQKQSFTDQHSMLTELELSYDDFETIFKRCLERGIEFMSTPFDAESAHFLNELGVKKFKVASGEITNFPLLRQIATYGKPIILSTGMALLDEISWAVGTLRRFSTKNLEIVLLHCNTAYPTPLEDVNLKVMVTLRKHFRLPVGYSDHTTGIELPIAAAALGASVIEKHFTLDRTMHGPDHAASLDPQELRAMVQAVRNVKLALGDGRKRRSPSEERNVTAARKSIVAAKTIKKGEKFTEENITTKRPCIGLSPMLWEEVIGKTAKHDFKPDQMIEL